MKRTKLSDRVLPAYSVGEDRMNMITHIAGGALMALGAVLCILRAAENGAMAVWTTAIYALTLLAVYTMSSIYHGLKPGTAKKVMQVIDHCTIYFLIAGTYTPIVLCAIRPLYPVIGWGLLGFQWIMAVTAAVLTAIDLRRYRVLSMCCYIGMGWSIVFFLPQTLRALGTGGFLLVLLGGIAYSVGAVLFALGKRKQWMHSVFHIFVILGSLFQLLGIYLYVL